jgi:hypothetical protein
MSEEYWFARRFPIGSPRAGLAPVHWKGYAVVAIYVVVLLAGALAFAWFGAHDNMMEGIAFFVLAAFLGGIFYITVARQKGDRVRTVADYKKDRKRV